MALKDSWVDKKDGDYILAEDINAVAHGVIDIEVNLPQTIEEKLGEAKESGEFDGKDGLSAYELALKNGTTTAKSEAEWLASLKGGTGSTPDLLYHYLVDGNVIMPETAVTFDSRAGAYLMDKYTLTVGKEYFVITNGVKTKATAVEYDGGVMLGVAIGDLNTDNYEFYSIVCYDTLKWVNGTHCYTMIMNAYRVNASATIAILEVDYMIDPKYIPNMYYEEGGLVEVLPETKLTAPDPENNPGQFIIAENYPELVIGTTYKVIWNGVEYTGTALDGSSIGEPEGYVMLFNDGVDLSTGAGLVFGIVYAPGELIMFMDTSGANELTVSIFAGAGTIHKIDNKFLDLEWIPETKTVKGDEVVAETTLTYIENASDYRIQDHILSCEVGKKYIVKWRGTEYLTEAVNSDIELFGGKVILGNLGRFLISVGLQGIDTGEPFIICGKNTVVSVTQFTPLDNSTDDLTVSIHEATEQVNKIPEKFLPEVEIVDLSAYMADFSANNHVTFGDSEISSKACAIARNADKLFVFMGMGSIEQKVLLTKTLEDTYDGKTKWVFSGISTIWDSASNTLSVGVFHFEFNETNNTVTFAVSNI